MVKQYLQRIQPEILILLVVIAATAIHYLLHFNFTVDDAAISFSYARNFAEGFGLGALYPGAARVEGYSNLFWVILLGSGTRLGFDTLMLSKTLGLLFALGCVALLFLILRDFLQHKWMLLGLLLLPASLTFVFWSVSGLENSLYAFLILLSVYLLIQEEHNPTRLPIGSAATLLLVAITRPEGIIYAVAGMAYKILQTVIIGRKGDGDARRQRVKGLLIWSAVFLLGYGLFRVWHLWYFAYWWPNPLYAKAAWRSSELLEAIFQPEGWVYLRGYFRSIGAIYLIPLILLGGLLSLRNEIRVLAIFALASLVLPVITHDWMINYRFIYPFVPFQVALIVIAADQLWDWLFRKKGNPIWLRAGALAVGIVFAFFLARSTWANIRLSQSQLECGYEKPWAEARCIGDRNYWSMGEVSIMYAGLGEYADQIGVEDALYLIPDIGGTSYIHNYRILDLAGLADIHLARSRGTQTLEQYIFQEQLPEFILTHSIWTRRTDITALSALWDHYIPIKYREDPQGHVHGTFVRKDLIIEDISGQKNSTEIAPGLVLAEVQAPDAMRPGYSYPINLYWFISKPQEKIWEQRVVLIDQQGSPVFENIEPLGYGWYPTTGWGTDELIRQHLSLPADLPGGEYTLQVTAVDAAGNPSGGAGFRHTLTIDEQAAYEYSAALQRSAEESAAQGDYHTAQRTLETASTAYPGSPELDAQLEQYREKVHLQLLSEAQEYLQAGELEPLMAAIQETNELRGRRQSPPEWKLFGEHLKSAADEASSLSDWETAYILYWAASAVNPDDSRASRHLEEARMLYIYQVQ